MARTQLPNPPFVSNLAVEGETTKALATRWREEVERRAHHDVPDIVLGLGSHDLDEGISLARSRLYLANLLDDMERAGARLFVVGPPPRRDVAPGQLAELTQAYQGVCTRRSVPYVDTYFPLATHEQFLADMAMSPGIYPTQVGYGLMAWLVLHNGWYEWLGVRPPVDD